MTAELTYFDGRGLAESVRFMLAATGTKFTEVFLEDQAHLRKLRDDGCLIFNEVPLLKIDGLQLVQSQAICRYLARKHGMDGKTPEEKARVDMINEGARHLLSPFFMIGFDPNTDVLIENIKTYYLAKYLPRFEKLLANSSSGYLVGDSLTYADMTLLEALLNSEEYHPGCLTGFPKVQEFLVKVGSLPRMKEYIEGPQRKGKNTPEIVNHASSVMIDYRFM
ncbi:glutathione S-transferase alpha I-like [Glandiceps talaboti]